MKTTAVRQQFVEPDIPAYFAYAKQFTLCDRYFTDVAGPSTPNHLMLIAADSPFIDNPKPDDQTKISSSLPASLEANGISWSNYGGYAFQYLSGINSKGNLTSDQFKVDASAGKLPSVSWVFAPSQFDEHPPDTGKGQMGNVTVGSQWTVDQINAIVKGGLWSNTAIFITWDDWEDGGTMWTHLRSRPGILLRHNQTTEGRNSGTALGWAAWCWVSTRGKATSRRPSIHTSAS